MEEVKNEEDLLNADRHAFLKDLLMSAGIP